MWVCAHIQQPAEGRMKLGHMVHGAMKERIQDSQQEVGL